ncbi:MAG: PQQ-dependent sugar dehydrogenase [Pseudonocardiaceae bacterium]|nr:PQQ-dependent sugar dehydrogenase [Pseudonocardiaceae bacterium]
MHRQGARALAAGVALILTACTTGTSSQERQTAEAPALRVTEIAGGLEHGWDVGFLPDGQLLVPQRPGRLALVSGTQPGATAREVRADFSDVLVSGEGGLMGMVVHPDFAESRRFTTCQTHERDGQAVDVRLVTWQLARDGGSARRVADPLLAGLPVNPSGRHSGCRPTMGPDGSLLVGTGDSASAAVAQDRASLGGKVLRLDLNTGEPLRDNPFADSRDRNERFVYSYGHRNVQGVAVRPGTDQVLLSEHGPSEDDEVNLLRRGGNYGWDPSRGGTEHSYDEDVPMTDRDRFPDAIRPLWTSGDTTEAICGAAFLSGRMWGQLDGALAVVALRGAKLLLFTLNRDGAVREVALPGELDERYGRLRAARAGPDGALYVTTTNGADDQLLRVTPAR